MKKQISAIFYSCLLSSLCAWAQGAGPTKVADQEFVTFAAQNDMAEAHLGQLAAEQASSQAVKEYAQMLVTDHTKDYQQLSMLAQKAGVDVPKELDASHIKLIAPLQKLKGPAFDRRFATQNIAAHETAAAAYDKESRDGQNPDLKAYATQTIPILEKHKNEAQQLSKAGKSAK